MNRDQAPRALEDTRTKNGLTHIRIKRRWGLVSLLVKEHRNVHAFGSLVVGVLVTSGLLLAVKTRAKAEACDLNLGIPSISGNPPTPQAPALKGLPRTCVGLQG